MFREGARSLKKQRFAADQPAQRTRSLASVLAGVLAVAMVAIMPAPALAAPDDFAFGVLRVDANKNGIADSTGVVGDDDLPLEGATVTLADSSTPAQTWTTTTAADGTWAFKTADVSGTGPYTVSIDVDGVGGDVYATYDATSADNDFVRPNTSVNQQAESASFNSDQTELNALVYPSRVFNIAIPTGPGQGGFSIATGTAPFDPAGSGSEPGMDEGPNDDKVRSADIVSYDWSITAPPTEDTGTLEVSDFYFEQTIELGPGAVANFAQLPAVCDVATSTVTAQPSGTVINVKEDPPAGTTSVVLACNMGTWAADDTQRSLQTLVQPSNSSANGSEFTVSARAYSVDPTSGVPNIVPGSSEDYGPTEITSAPRFDVEKVKSPTSFLGFYDTDGDASTPNEFGRFIIYTVQIGTDRKVGTEAMSDEVTMRENFWAARSVAGPNTGEDVGDSIDDLRWYLTSCIPSPSPRNWQTSDGLVYGKLFNNGSASTLQNSVRDSGTCLRERSTPGDDSSPYDLTLEGIDSSGISYPTEDALGVSLAAGPYYVASYRMSVFVPNSEVDRAQGDSDDGEGEFSVYNRIDDFDPDSVSGASNFGSDFEPGYCAPGPGGDGVANCDNMEDGGRSNNVVGPNTIRISSGTWGKSLVAMPEGPGGPSGALPGQTGPHSGNGLVQPGEIYFSSQGIDANSNSLASPELCDVFDNTTFKLADASEASVSGGSPFPSGTYSDISERNIGQVSWAEATRVDSEWDVKYASVPMGSDSANTGVLDSVNDVFEGNWTNQKAATNAESTVCGSDAVAWYDSPFDVPGGIDAVNVVWANSDDSYVLDGGRRLAWLLPLQQRDVFFGGPNDGEKIPAGTVSANFGNVKLSSTRDWIRSGYMPGAGETQPLPSGQSRHPGENGSTQGDRWIVQRASMALQKRTIDAEVDGVDSTGVSDYGVTGAAVSGRPVVWEVNATVTAASTDPADVENVVITDTLPEYVTYDEAATTALSGGTPASSVTNNPDGTTTLTWNLGTVTPNEDIAPIRIVTQTDPLAPNNTSVVNEAIITADGMVPVSAHEDTHTIRLEQSGAMQAKKSVDRTLDLQDDEQEYTLQLKSFSETNAVAAPTIIDVLPYNGDASNDANVNRAPESTYVGTNTLTEAPQAFAFDGTTPLDGTFYYTTVDPATVPQHLSDDDPSLWSDTFTPNATAFKFVADNALATASDEAGSGIVITYTTNQDGNDAGDLYSNRFSAFSDTYTNAGRYQLLASNLTTVRVVGFSLGDFVWFDEDGDGAFDASVDETAPEGVTVQVYDADDNMVGETQTDAEGRWVVNDLPAGDYYVLIPATEFATGALLETYQAAANPVVDANTNENEDVDHQAVRAPGGGVRSSGYITLDADTAADPITGNEPIGDNVGNVLLSPLTSDDFSNLTVDLALGHQGKLKVEKLVEGDDLGEAFSVLVNCVVDGDNSPGYPQTLVFGGEDDPKWEYELVAEVGSVCTAMETDAGSATRTVITPLLGVTIANADDEHLISVTNIMPGPEGPTLPPTEEPPAPTEPGPGTAGPGGPTLSDTGLAVNSALIGLLTASLLIGAAAWTLRRRAMSSTREVVRDIV